MKKMIRRTMKRQGQWIAAALIGVGITGCASGSTNSGGWLQWGGPHRDFTVEVEGLANAWPEEGPDKIWHRELGDGYSTIVADGGRLYTMYRIDQDEFTVALDAETGDTIWEHKNHSPTTPLMEQFGAGPHSTPQVAGSRLFAIGSNAVLHCYDKNTGKVLWKRDLPEEFSAPVPGRGYGASPFAHKNTIIVPVGRVREDNEEDQAEEGPVDGQSLIAFDQATGKVAWKSQDYRVGYSSPILIDFQGEPQLVLLLTRGIMGVCPDTGKLLWHLEFDGPQGANIATPVWNGDDLLFCSSAYDSGSRLVKLTKEDGKTSAEQLWYSRKLRIHHGNAIQIGDHVYASSGDFGPAFFVALDLDSGKPTWRERGFKKTTSVYADGKIILLDEDGELSLVSATPDGLTVHSKCTIAERYAWAAPTLVGKTLYVRDRKHIMALDLG